MSSDRDPPTDDTLMPDKRETGGIPLGMQAGAKAGGDVVDRKRGKPGSVPAGELEDAATGDTRGAVTRVAGSEADAIGGSGTGGDGDQPSPLTGRTDPA